MNEVSLFRLYVLRAFYLLFAVGLGIFDWPGIFDPHQRWVLMEGQESTCMVAAFSLLCVFGIRYPLKMLPVLLWEVIWKTLWLVTVPLAQWIGTGHVDASLQPMIFACSIILPAYIVIPWKYLVLNYAMARSDRWIWQNRRVAEAPPSWT